MERTKYILNSKADLLSISYSHYWYILTWCRPVPSGLFKWGTGTEFSWKHPEKVGKVNFYININIHIMRKPVQFYEFNW